MEKINTDYKHELEKISLNFSRCASLGTYFLRQFIKPSKSRQAKSFHKLEDLSVNHY